MVRNFAGEVCSRSLGIARRWPFGASGKLLKSRAFDMKESLTPTVALAVVTDAPVTTQAARVTSPRSRRAYDRDGRVFLMAAWTFSPISYDAKVGNPCDGRSSCINSMCSSHAYRTCRAADFRPDPRVFERRTGQRRCSRDTELGSAVEIRAGSAHDPIYPRLHAVSRVPTRLR